MPAPWKCQAERDLEVMTIGVRTSSLSAAPIVSDSQRFLHISSALRADGFIEALLPWEYPPLLPRVSLHYPLPDGLP